MQKSTNRADFIWQNSTKSEQKKAGEKVHFFASAFVQTVKGGWQGWQWLFTHITKPHIRMHCT